MSKITNEKVVAQGGIQIPGGAASGSLAVSDASGNVSWKTRAQAGIAIMLWGNSTDGAVTLDGTTTVPWATLSGSIYTMSRDCHCTTLVVNAGVTIAVNGYAIFASVSITNNGTISRNPGSGTANGGVTVMTANAVGGGGNGGAGNVGAGSAGGNGMGGLGGAGGSVGATAGGATGTNILTSNGTTVANAPYILTPMVVLSRSYQFANAVRTLVGGVGGGGGAGDGTNKGGGGGSGGGIILISTPTFTNNGTLSCVGGSGGTPTTGNAGGGAGGGGGWVFVVTTTAATMGTVNVAGGTHGNGVGTGANGTDGASGWSSNWVIAV